MKLVSPRTLCIIVAFGLIFAVKSWSQVPAPVTVATMSSGAGFIGLSKPTDVFVQGNYAYVADYAQVLYVIDISDPFAPKYSGRVQYRQSTSAYSHRSSVFVSGNYAYLTSTESNSLDIIDITNPASPVRVGGLIHGAGGAKLKRPMGLYVSEGYAYIASSGSMALEVIDVTDPTQPIHKGSLTYSGGPVSVSMSGYHAYLAGPDGLEIVDVFDPTSPIHRGSLQYGSSPKLQSSRPEAIAVSGNFAYLVEDRKIEIVDVTNVTLPRSTGVLYLKDVTDASSVRISGNHAFITCPVQNTLAVVDITDPLKPVQTAHLQHGTGGAYLKGAQSVYVVGNYAYVADGTGAALEIVNVDVKHALVHNGYYSLTKPGASFGYGVKAMHIAGKYAYVANSDPYFSINSLEVVDISDPFVPVHASTLNHGAGGALLKMPVSITVSGGYAFVASKENNALEILSLADPAKPAHAASVVHGEGGAMLSAPTSVFVSGDYAYVVSEGSDALEIVDITNPKAPVHKSSLSNGSGGALLLDPTCVYVSGSHAFVTSAGSNALEVIDISNPQNPVHKASLSHNMGGALLLSPQSVFISGDYAFVASSGSNALEIINVSNPAAPVHKSSLQDEVGGAKLNTPQRVYVSGNLAYLSSVGVYSSSGSALVELRPNALEIVDITNLDSPFHRASIDYHYYNAWAKSLFVAGNYLYLTQSANFHILSVFEPVAPRGLSAILTEVTTLEASWNAVPYADGYYIDVSADDFATYLPGYENKFVNTPSMKIEGLASGTWYKVRVRTKNANGISKNSPSVSVWTGMPPVALEAIDITSTTFMARWQMPEPVKPLGYLLDVSKDNFKTFVSHFQNYNTGTVQSFFVESLQSGETYQYRVRVLTPFGISAYSNVVQVITAGVKPPVALSATNVHNTGFTMNWTAVTGADEYYFDVLEDGFYELKNVAAGNVTSFVLNGLERYESYQYVVRAKGPSGTSVNSNTIGVLTKNIPSPPLALDATNVTETTFTANWVRQPWYYFERYYIDVAYDMNPNASDDATFVSGNFVTGFENKYADAANAIQVTGLSPGKQYRYRVRARAEITSGNSNSISVRTVLVTGLGSSPGVSFTIHPNPVSSDVIKVEIPDLIIGDATLYFFNATGQQVIRQPLTRGEHQHSISIGLLKEGLYAVVLETDQNKLVQRIIVRR